ncbi:aminotransferase-like domain-containing protein [Cellulomonas soli]|nr:PLP-dependent aminotransferase family protein [Cellulomonas soli]NYI59990.1 DNA-binding transcriptional MocR family regulator [Cellulomonas soli]
MNDDSSARRLADTLRAVVRAAPAGARLPSSRTLAAEHGVGPVTVAAALRLLAAEGLVETRPGEGTFARRQTAGPGGDTAWQLTAMGPAAVQATALGALLHPSRPGTIALSSGYLAPEQQPHHLVSQALARAARRPAALGRVDPTGLPELRAWFATEAGAQADDVLVCAGTQAALATIFTSLCRPGDAVVMESPTYLGALAAAHAAGLTIVPVHRGPDGAPDPLDLDRALQASGARVVYAQPHGANPTGTSWPARTHRELVAVARRHGCFLVEDDWAHDFVLAGTPRTLAADDPDGTVLHLRSLTKSTVPALRVAAVVGRGPVVARLAAGRTAADLYVSGVLQHAALDVVTGPGWRRHVRAARTTLIERRDSLAAAVVRHLGAESLALVPDQGLHLWVRLPDGTDDVALAAAAAGAGVDVSAGSPWWVTEPVGPYLRISYSAATPAEAAHGVEVLAGLLPDLPGTR